MRTYSLNELFSLTRAELLALHAEIIGTLAQLPDDDAERPILLANLSAVRRALATPQLTP